MVASVVPIPYSEAHKVEAPIIEEPIKDDLDLWIDELVEYECPDCPDNFRIIDTNNRYSYSCLQFQEETFKGYIRRYDLFPETEDHELMNLIYHCDIQKKLAKLMIQENPKNWQHWYTSVAIRGLGIPPKAL